MAFKAAVVVMAPDGDPTKHRTSIKTSMMELTTVVVPLGDFDRATQVCQDLVQKEGTQSIILCPGFTSEAVSMVSDAVGQGVPINVARGDVPSVMATFGLLQQEGWF
jgi:hypothetical protein